MTWRQEFSAEDRPAYLSKPRRLPTTTVDEDDFANARILDTGRRFALHNLRFRLALTFVGISALVLIVMGMIITATGLAQVRAAELDGAQATVTDIQRFGDRVARGEARVPVRNTYDLLYGFLASARAEPDSDLFVIIDGQVRLHQQVRGVEAYTDADLVETVNRTPLNGRSKTLLTATKRTRYLVTVIPVRYAASAPAILVLAHDDRRASAPTLNLVRIFIGVSLLVLVLTAIVTWFVAARMLAPLARLRAMTRSVASGDDLSRRLPVKGNDDLTDLAVSFNGMVDRLQGAFEEQRHLLNDVGHELRTPLTVISGHLELMNPRDANDAQHSRDLALEEVARMHRMTEDLVMVATSSRPDFVKLAATDIYDLTVEVYQHAQQLGGSWRLEAAASVVARADQQRMSQALLQLCENAVKFSGQNAQLDIGSAVDTRPRLLDRAGRVLDVAPVAPLDMPVHPQAQHEVALWVRDHGDGIEAKNQQRIFERFARVDHAHPGSGLGLSIVAAIMRAHHGRVELTSAPGYGSVFTLYLPLGQDQGTENTEGIEQ